MGRYLKILERNKGIQVRNSNWLKFYYEHKYLIKIGGRNERIQARNQNWEKF